MNKKTKPKLNIRLLRRIQKHILEEPRRFFMEGKVATGKPGEEFTELHCCGEDLSDTVPDCGTAGCIMGWAAMLLGKTPKQTRNLSLWWASKRLGLPTDRCLSLFIADDWPRSFAARYLNAKTQKTRARIGAARIDYLITTGK